MIRVVAGAVTAADGRVLIADRPSGKHLAGHWEFPGGKLETGETPVQALAREMREELGIIIRTPRPLMRVRHTYDIGEVQIDLWVVSQYSGEPQGLDGQRLRWCTLDELENTELLIADQPLVRALRLPERLIHAASNYYVVGGSHDAGDARLHGASCESVEEGVSAVVQHAAGFLVMSDAAAPEKLATLCEAVSVPVFAVGVSVQEAWELGASGVSELRLT